MKNACRWMAAVLALAAAGAARGQEAEPAPAAVVLEPLDGWRGIWLTNATAEVFVAAEPAPRVVVFRTRGGTSPFRSRVPDPYVGVMTWFKEPGQTAGSPLPANRPAELDLAGPRDARLKAQPVEDLGLRVEMQVRLDEKAPRLRVRHGLTNTGKAERTLAVWAVAALPRAGTVLLPFPGDGQNPPGVLHVWDGVVVNQPGIETGDLGLTVDLAAAYRGRALRLGVPGAQGWVAYARDGLVARATVAVDPAALYPERGTTGAVFAEPGPGPLAAVEQVGPLRRIAPGTTAWLEQDWELFPGAALPSSLADARFQALPPAAR